MHGAFVEDWKAKLLKLYIVNQIKW